MGPHLGSKLAIPALGFEFGFGVWGLGLGFGFGVWSLGLGFRVWVWGLGLGFGFGVWSLGLGFGDWVWGLGLGFGVGVWGWELEFPKTIHLVFGVFFSSFGLGSLFCLRLHFWVASQLGDENPFSRINVRMQSRLAIASLHPDCKAKTAAAETIDSFSRLRAYQVKSSLAKISKFFEQQNSFGYSQAISK